MKGLYLNVPAARERATRLDALLAAPSAIATAEHQGHSLLVDYHPRDWPAGPIHCNLAADLTAAGSGWFHFRGRFGNLSGFAEAFAHARTLEERKALAAEIPAGAFVILILRGASGWLVTDPFGLHPHYSAGETPFARLAPSVYFFGDDESGAFPADESLTAALEVQNHLFGNYTTYAGIRRLDPGTITSATKVVRYFDYQRRESPAAADIAQAANASSHRGAGSVLGRAPLARLGEVMGLFAERRRILPLSGGLDSRLLLASARFDYGYTFGPAESGDRPVARRYANHFEDYDEFSLLELDYPARLRAAGRQVFSGTCARPFVELLAVYRRLAERWGGGCLFFDGYGGDVLQRALYLTSGGLRGSAAKMFPHLTRARFDPLVLLNRRYPGLDHDARKLLVKTYHQMSEDWDLDPLRSVTLFELLYGRGSRYVINGGTILSQEFRRWPQRRSVTEWWPWR